jgi:hypothetical protein
MRIFVFHTKNNGFLMVLNSQLQPTSERAERAPTSERAERAERAPTSERAERAERRDALSAPAHFLSEILKMLTVEAYRKDI